MSNHTSAIFATTVKEFRDNLTRCSENLKSIDDELVILMRESDKETAKIRQLFECRDNRIKDIIELTNDYGSVIATVRNIK